MGSVPLSAQKGDEKFSASHIVPKTSRPADKPKALICIAASMNSSSIASKQNKQRTKNGDGVVVALSFLEFLQY
jgi:hypothetical protein